MQVDNSITVFSFGAGQESTYLLHRFMHDPEFRKRHVRGKLICVGSDTGDEHPHTKENIRNLKLLCAVQREFFEWITPDKGYHSKTWQSLTGQYKRNSGIGSAAFIQTCTDNLKIKVVDRFVEELLKRQYNIEQSLKRAYYHYMEVADGVKIRLILGFAKGEESRTSRGNELDPKWKKDCVERYFPLIVDGIDRQACIDYNQKHIPWQVWPSNCMRCFYQSEQEVLWLHRNYPEKFQEWVEMEKAKLKKWEGAEKNYGVYKGFTLEQKLEKAIKLYGHWSDEQLNEYKFSHGHCIKSKY